MLAVGRLAAALFGLSAGLLIGWLARGAREATRAGPDEPPRGDDE